MELLYVYVYWYRNITGIIKNMVKYLWTIKLIAFPIMLIWLNYIAYGMVMALLVGEWIIGAKMFGG